MAKPSIFSREYEKRMKKRKRNSIVTLLIVVIVGSLIVLKFAYNPVDFGKIKQNMQAWIDSDPSNKAEENEPTVEEVATEDDASNKEEVKKEEPKEQTLDVSLISGKVAKAVYIENENGEKTFESLKDIDSGVTFDISPSKKQMIVCDTNAQITLYNIDGSNKIVSVDKYVSSKGTTFTKDATLASNPGYLWNSNPKFLNEENIVFVSNRPFFGTAATKQYVWITNLNTVSAETKYGLEGKSVQIDGKEGNKLKITVDGNVRYIGEDGNIIQ